ncbi:unnamed protein product [Schistosoma margrebowiei]|uniref:Uncharacterized protein n=1 Tax=Schistosoma margrebowiei TaxID=48269 RepID=A0A183MRW0_9TREM|nr:unnamed protein product [Schistosoma margrebowiei]
MLVKEKLLLFHPQPSGSIIGVLIPGAGFIDKLCRYYLNSHYPFLSSILEISVCLLFYKLLKIFRIEHLKYHEDHKGHEKMHLEMFLVAFVSLLFCQLVLMFWKKRHFRSYQLVTLIAMWLVPFIYSVLAEFPRFIFVWVLFSLTTGVMVYLASKKRISTTTPSLPIKFYLSLSPQVKFPAWLIVGGLVSSFCSVWKEIVGGQRLSMLLIAPIHHFSLLFQYHLELSSNSSFQSIPYCPRPPFSISLILLF